MKGKLSTEGFAEFYYCYDFNQPEASIRQPFFYSHNRHNAFAMNLALMTLQYETPALKARIGLHAGTYVEDNYSSVPEGARNISEANIEFSPGRKKKFRFGAGIFPSYIGFESAVSKDCRTPTRSILAENSPYFMTEAKASFSPTEKWEFTALISNGWQRMVRVEGNSLYSYGTQVKCNYSEKLSFNWSTFIGTDDPDSLRRMRYFNNWYSNWQISGKLGLTAGFDLGMQQSQKKSRSYQTWCSPVLIAQYRFTKKWAAAVRGEYYADHHHVIVSQPAASPIDILGASANLDFAPDPKLLLRIEARYLHSPYPDFYCRNGYSDNDFFVSVSIGASM